MWGTIKKIFLRGSRNAVRSGVPAKINNSIPFGNNWLARQYPENCSSSNSLESQIRNVRRNLISKHWQTLAAMYCTEGIVQTLIDAPVNDGFAKGFSINCKELTGEQKRIIDRWMRDHKVTNVVKEALRWMRLYGGAGIIIDIHGDLQNEPLLLDDINSDQDITLIPASMWELYFGAEGYDDLPQYDNEYAQYQSINYNYKSIIFHNTRVFRMVGKQAPDYTRAYLHGWGLSEIEGVVSALNRYIKGIDASFELIDECKVDVYKVNGFNSAMLGVTDPSVLMHRFDAVNVFKNYKNAIVIDSEDEFDQKCMKMDWLPSTMAEIRRQLSSELSIPENRLFGIGASGFSDGDDTQENYHTLVKGTVQEPIKDILRKIVKIACANTLDWVPDDVDIEFPSLQSMTEKEEEETKTKKLERILMILERGLLSVENAKKAINKERIIEVEIDETGEVYTMVPLGDTPGKNFDESDDGEGNDGGRWPNVKRLPTANPA